jgi:hypothetical protein
MGVMFVRLLRGGRLARDRKLCGTRNISPISQVRGLVAFREMIAMSNNAIEYRKDVVLIFCTGLRVTKCKLVLSNWADPTVIYKPNRPYPKRITGPIYVG